MLSSIIFDNGSEQLVCSASRALLCMHASNLPFDDFNI